MICATSVACISDDEATTLRRSAFLPRQLSEIPPLRGRHRTVSHTFVARSAPVQALSLWHGLRMRFDAVVVGNVGIDTNVYQLEPEADFVESSFTRNADCIGQAGGYSSLSLAALGCRTGFIGYVGRDPLGDWIRSTFEAKGVQGLWFDDPLGTSRSINLMAPDGTRRTFYDGKEHWKLAPDLSRCASFIAGARFVHVHLPDWARHLLPKIRRPEIVISCDLQDVVDPKEPYRQDFIRAADVLFFSSVNVSAQSTAEALAKANPRATIVAGLGASGAGLWADGVWTTFPPASLDDPVTDTNGAGDSLAMGFMTATVLYGRPTREAVIWGQVAARHTCTLRGKSEPLITLDVLRTRVAEYLRQHDIAAPRP